MAGADLVKRIITTCGECLMRWDPEHSTKSPKTAHRIVGRGKDDELNLRFIIIECTRCGTKIHWYPRHKATREIVKNLKDKAAERQEKRRKLKREAKERRLKKDEQIQASKKETDTES
jgi:hypothetical protein